MKLHVQPLRGCDISDSNRFIKIYAKELVKLGRQVPKNLTAEVIDMHLRSLMGNECSVLARELVSKELNAIKKISFGGVSIRTPGPNLP